MPKPMMTVPSINLAKRQGKFFETFIHWALTAGRAAVIVTEGIALSAFLYRFSLDRQIIDLHDKIKQEQAIVTLLKNNEDSYRNLQARLNLIDALNKQAAKTQKTFFDILHIIPNDVTVDNLQFTQNTMKFNIEARSLVALQTLVNGLKGNATVKAISVDSIENKISTATIIMSITAYFNDITNS